jgi:hypothetical protein
VRLKDARFYVNTALLDGAKKLLIHCPAEFGRRRLDEAGTATAARIAVQGELGRGEKRSASIEQRAIHFAVRIAENSQIYDPFHHSNGGSGRIFATDGKENHQTRADLTDHFAFDSYSSTRDTLDYGSHEVCAFTAAPLSCEIMKRTNCTARPKPVAFAICVNSCAYVYKSFRGGRKSARNRGIVGEFRENRTDWDTRRGQNDNCV